MKTTQAFSSMCRACAQRTSHTAPQTPSLRSAPSRSRTLNTKPQLPYHTKPQQSRLLSTSTETSPSATHENLPAVAPAQTPSTTITTATPTSLTPLQLLTLPSPSPSLPGPILTATITSIHARTAHATRTLPISSAKLHKSFLGSTHDLVHDPYDLLRVGDVIRYSPFTPAERAKRESVKEECKEVKWGKLKSERRRLVGRRKPGDGKRSKRVRVRYVVRQVVSCWGVGLEERAREMEERKGRALALVGAGGGGTAVEVRESKSQLKRSGKGSGKKSIVAAVQAEEGVLAESNA